MKQTLVSKRRKRGAFSAFGLVTPAKVADDRDSALCADLVWIEELQGQRRFAAGLVEKGLTMDASCRDLVWRYVAAFEQGLDTLGEALAERIFGQRILLKGVRVEDQVLQFFPEEVGERRGVTG